jgi:hypothetical protein
MLKSIRRIVCCAAVLTVLSLVVPAAARADDPPDQSDYNAVWQYAESPAQPDPGNSYNTYYQEVQDKQLVDQGQ